VKERNQLREEERAWWVRKIKRIIALKFRTYGGVTWQQSAFC